MATKKHISIFSQERYAGIWVKLLRLDEEKQDKLLSRTLCSNFVEVLRIRQKKLVLVEAGLHQCQFFAV